MAEMIGTGYNVAVDVICNSFKCILDNYPDAVYGIVGFVSIIPAVMIIIIMIIIMAIYKSYRKPFHRYGWRY